MAQIEKTNLEELYLQLFGNNITGTNEETATTPQEMVTQLRNLRNTIDSVLKESGATSTKIVVEHPVTGENVFRKDLMIEMAKAGLTRSQISQVLSVRYQIVRSSTIEVDVTTPQDLKANTSLAAENLKTLEFYTKS